MNFTTNLLNNSDLSKLATQAGSQITAAIHQASQKTGVDFSYLMHQANAESSFRTDIQAQTSSATGLYQFIEKTWLGMIRDHGEKHGLAEFSQAIDENASVSDPSVKEKILELRKDPEIASIMAAEFAAANKEFLETKTNLKNTDIGATELYFAHFMGANGAKSFLEALEDNPLASGANLFPKEARANRGVFFDKQTGAPKTLAEIYDHFNQKFGNQASSDTNTIPATSNLLQAQENSYRVQPQQYIRAFGQQSTYTDMQALASTTTIDQQAIWDIVMNKGSSFIRNEQQISLDLLNSLSINPVETMILANLTSNDSHYSNSENR